MQDIVIRSFFLKIEILGYWKKGKSNIVHWPSFPLMPQSSSYKCVLRNMSWLSSCKIKGKNSAVFKSCSVFIGHIYCLISKQ